MYATATHPHSLQYVPIQQMQGACFTDAPVVNVSFSNGPTMFSRAIRNQDSSPKCNYGLARLVVSDRCVI